MSKLDTITQTTFHLGGWYVDTKELTLTATNQKGLLQTQELRPKVMQVLSVLIQRQGQLVSREELINEVWQGNQFVGENGLTDAIWQLRKHLDEDIENAPYIQTTPKKGYRLVVGCTSYSGTNPLQKAPNKNVIFVSVSTLLLLVIFVFYTTNSGEQASEIPVHTTITQHKGNETYPDISPDGKYLLYTQMPSAGKFQIYLKDLQEVDSPPRLVEVAKGLQAGFATWAQDSNKIGFIASDLKTKCELRTYELISDKEESIGECSTRYISSISWHSENNLVAFSDKDPDKDTAVIYLLNTETLERTQLTKTSQSNNSFDNNPRFSPSGEKVVFVRNIGVGNSDLYITDLQGELEKLTQWNASIMGFTWAEDENKLLVAVLDNNKITLNHFNLVTEQRIQVNLDGHSGAFPDFHPATNQLVVSKRSLDRGLMALNINPTPNTIRVKALFQSPSSDIYPNYSAATKQYAFISNRDGYDELWLADEGGQFTKLTDFRTQIYSPAWSPDGKEIAFTAADSKNKFRQLFVIDVTTQKTTQLTYKETDHAPPTWSSDGQFLYSGISDKGVFYLWRVDMQGNSQQLLTFPSIYAFDHPQKDTLLYTDMEQTGIFEYDFTNESTVKLIENNSRVDGSNWLTTPQGIYYVLRGEKHDAINYYEFNSDSHRTIMQFPAATISAVQTIALNSNTEEVIFVQRFKQESDIHRVLNPILR